MPFAIPDTLRPAWDKILDCEERLRQALLRGENESLDALAGERQQFIEQFFAAFPLDSASAPLREALLMQLLAHNEHLLGESHARLSRTADEAARARHNRRAIDAYGDIDATAPISAKKIEQ
jgi:Flagellar protein FliT